MRKAFIVGICYDNDTNTTSRENTAMGSFSIWHWFTMFMFGLVVWLAVAWPIARILTRTGHSKWLAVLALIPGVNWISLWIFAYKPWPREGE